MGAIYAQASTECTPALNVCSRWRLKDLLCIRTLLSISPANAAKRDWSLAASNETSSQFLDSRSRPLEKSATCRYMKGSPSRVYGSSSLIWSMRIHQKKRERHRLLL